MKRFTAKSSQELASIKLSCLQREFAQRIDQLSSAYWSWHILSATELN